MVVWALQFEYVTDSRETRIFMTSRTSAHWTHSKASSTTELCIISNVSNCSHLDLECLRVLQLLLSIIFFDGDLISKWPGFLKSWLVLYPRWRRTLLASQTGLFGQIPLIFSELIMRTYRKEKRMKFFKKKWVPNGSASQVRCALLASWHLLSLLVDNKMVGHIGGRRFFFF